jgi:hypothetical protein
MIGSVAAHGRRANTAFEMSRLRAFSGKVASGFPSENATNAKMLERFLSPVYVKPP